MNDGNINGYIIKLYKKIDSCYSPLKNDNFDFLTWMTFDGMKVIPVEHINDYQAKSINYVAPDKIDMYCERQKIYLYKLVNNKKLKKPYIFSVDPTDNFAIQNPLITITLIKFKYINYEVNKFENELNSFVPNSITYDLFGSFSNDNLCLVCRSNNYSDFFDVLSGIRQLTYTYMTYTIAGVFIEGSINWLESQSLDISIRLSLLPQLNYYDLYKLNTKINKDTHGREILNVDSKGGIYQTLGKYDFGIRGTLNNSQEFLSLFDDTRGINRIGIKTENSDYLECAVLSSNTRLIFYKPEEKIDSKNIFDYSQPEQRFKFNFQKELDDIEKLFKDITYILELNKVAPSIIQNICRLYLRFNQLTCSPLTFSAAISTYQVIDNFFKILKSFIDTDSLEKNSQNIIDSFRSINILIDNLTSNNYRGFEMPHSNLTFTGTSYDLICAYTGYVKTLLTYIENNRRFQKQYIGFVTVEGSFATKAQLFFPKEKEKRFINVRIPIELLFNVKYVVSWITHEIGHFSSINWERCNRNLSYANSIFNVFLVWHFNEFGDYYKKDMLLNKFKKFKVQESNYLEDFSEKLYYKIYMMTFNDLKTDNKLHVREQKIKTIFEWVQNAYKEATADCFMISILNIFNYEDYFDILFTSLEYQNAVSKQFSANILIRIDAVSAFLYCVENNIDRKTYYKNYIKNRRKFYKNLKVESYKILEKIIFNNDNYMLILNASSELFNFLYKYFNNASFNELSEIKDTYYSLSKDSFHAAIDFINKFKYINEEQHFVS